MAKDPLSDFWLYFLWITNHKQENHLILHRFSYKVMMQSTLGVLVLLTVFSAAIMACPEAQFVTGPVYAGCTSNMLNVGCGQNAWGGFVGANLQTIVQTPPPPLTKSGTGALHIDNSVISGGFGFQTSSPPTMNLWAGSSALVNASLLTPGYQFAGDTFELSFDVYAVSSTPDGFFVSISMWNNIYPQLEDRDTYLALEYGFGSFHLLTYDDADGDNAQNFTLAPQQWHHVLQRCVFNNNATANDICSTYVNGTFVIQSTGWREATHDGVAEPHNYVEFRMARDPSYYGYPVAAVQGVQIDNYRQRIYNSTNPSSQYRYETNFDVAAANVDGCQRFPVQNGGTCILPGGTAIGSNGERSVVCAAGFTGPSCEFTAPPC